MSTVGGYFQQAHWNLGTRFFGQSTTDQKSRNENERGNADLPTYMSTMVKHIKSQPIDTENQNE